MAGLESVPPVWILTIAEHDFGIGTTQRQGEQWVVEMR
jgi:hypothetical protein